MGRFDRDTPPAQWGCTPMPYNRHLRLWIPCSPFAWLRNVSNEFDGAFRAATGELQYI
jgi:hypothetical protein